ncbi:hypothetical protein PR202_ga02590 [Eleusine coracana subsp. coracana]|uniref:RING-type E3 ubiquitin transferase n=1 Tax=Eleusine coracana subsp. coracana TaxID=191504 RepID=A0AAV5BM10_ELECO|nr:hypothetical protein PR202_ga02590 [Eleusine coracana subsp. coracana]
MPTAISLDLHRARLRRDGKSLVLGLQLLAHYGLEKDGPSQTDTKLQGMHASVLAAAAVLAAPAPGWVKAAAAEEGFHHTTALAAVNSQEDSMESGMAIMERQTARRTQTNVPQMNNIYDDLGSISASAFGSNAYMDVLIKSQGYSEADMSMNVVGNRPKRRSLHDIDTPKLVDFLQGMYHESHEFGGQMFSTLPEVAEYIEPLYDAFLCPLTNEVMNDPVTTESGVTYERRAIEEYIERFVDSSEPIYCPVTKMPMQSKTMASNVSLKSVIEEWIMRNEAMRVRIARTALSLSTADTMVLEAIHELKLLAKLRQKNRELMHKIGVTKFVARLLDNHNAQIRCDTLELLCLLVEDEEGKDIVGKTKAIARTVKLLSSSTTDERHVAISFLLELSKSQLLLEHIGSAAGSILILTTMKINSSDDPIASEKAGAVLKNLEKCPKNIKYMAESGYLEPLQRHLVEATLLSRLPYRNTSLNVALVEEHAMPTIMSVIKEMEKGTARTSRHAVPFMEGLVGALVRFTATLYSPEVLKAAMDHNLVSVFTNLLGGAAGSDEVQRLAAVGLENLSYISIKLSQPPPEELSSKKTIILKLRKDSKAHNNSKKNLTQQLNICLVHRGVCTPTTTFCLLEAGTVEGLLACLENDNVRVVEAALGALCTLLDERVDVEKSVAALVELDAVGRVLGALRQHRQNLLWQKCFCVVEKLLEHGDDQCMREVTGDRMLPTALVSAFHRGDASTKQAAESILRRLHKMPDYSVTYESMEF